MEEYAYDIFGKPYSINDEGKITRLKKSNIGNTRLYTGREYDRGLKLYYNRARYYDPKLARFISRDPIDIADDVNLYAYVGNNSVMFVDLMGTEKTLIVAFTGRTKSSFGEVDPNDDLGLWSTLNEFKNNDNYEVKFYYSSATKLGSEKWDAKKYIVDNKDNYSKLVVMGHSLGADNAVELSQTLNSDSIRVDLLLSIDLQAYIDTTSVEDNVMYAKNYYQTHWDSISNGAILSKSKGNNITELNNIESNNSCVFEECVNGDTGIDYYHTTIDYFLRKELINDIKNIN